jgi:uncharacterized membrane protein YdfJ with MMPL/SSD domain
VRDATGRLARACARHPWRTLALWGAVLVLSLGAVGGLLGSTLTTEAEMTNDPESYRAYDLLREHFPPSDDYVNELVVVRSTVFDVDDRAFRTKVAGVARALEETGVVQPVRTFPPPEISSSSRRAVARP